jgi:hypothetical protein
MSDRNPIDPVLSLSDIVPGSFEPFLPKFGGEAGAQKADIDPKSLSFLEEQAYFEA